MQDRGLKPWEPQEFSARHRHIVALSAVGWKGHEIATELRMSQSRVSTILNDPRAQVLREQICSEAIRNTVQSTGEYIHGMTLEAAETVAHLMRLANSEMVRLAAGKDILDRGGFKPREQIQHSHVHIDSANAELILETLRESQVEEAEYEFMEDSASLFSNPEDELQGLGSKGKEGGED